METKRELYSRADLQRLERKIRREHAWVWGLAAGTLCLCVLFCCLCTTANARQMELAAVVTSTLGGWLTIYRRLFGLQESRYELQHAEYLLTEPHTAIRGKLTVTDERLRIKNSIRIRILLLDDGEQVHRLKVNENRVRELQSLPRRPVTVYLAGGYVAGIGDCDADS